LAPELLVRELLDTNAMTAVIVSKDGMVEFINKTYLDILGKTEEEVTGRYIGEITPDTRTLNVIKTGKAIVGYNWSLNGYMMIACALPLIRNGDIAGCFAYSIFMDILDARDLVDNLVTELNMYKDEVRSLHSARYSFADIIGQAPNIEEVKFLAQKAALHPSITVLINGESGTGKELFAQAIHGTSNRSRMPFIRVNCAAIPENLLESELFGYEEGAFTGARKGGSPGKFELANGGTIFLDEIGEMSLAMQSKLLVFLQEREFERVGSHQPIRVNVRVIAATNRNLGEMISQQKFREDLFYRLNVLTLDIPPLRERIDDLPLLLNHFIPRLNLELTTNVTAISDEAIDVLSRYNWPGNIRELVNVLQRAMLVADMGDYYTITTKQLRFMKIQPEPPITAVSSTLKTMVKDYEKQILLQVLSETNYNKAKTASILDIDLSSLYKKLKQHGLADDS
jgi:Transcriptional regulator containing PAS, AAA-type ATPase, and DNA-binding domains